MSLELSTLWETISFSWTKWHTLGHFNEKQFNQSEYILKNKPQIITGYVRILHKFSILSISVVTERLFY